MTPYLKNHWPKCLFVLAASCVVLSFGWVWREASVVRRIRALPVRLQAPGATYQTKVVLRTESPPVNWAEPTDQPAGRGWRYDLFTPPVVYFDAKTGSFAVTPVIPAAGGSPVPAGLELMGVRPEQFRLQLIAYFGGPGDLVGVFVESSRTGVILAREGFRFENLGFILRRLAVEKIGPRSGEAWPAYETAAVAVLLDESTGAEVRVNSRDRRLTGRTLALIRKVADDTDWTELGEGDTISDGGFIYRVERIQLQPPEVAVVKLGSGQLPVETSVLRLAPAKLTRPAGSPTRRVRGPDGSPPQLASNDK